VFVVGLVLCSFFVIRQVRGGLFIGIVITTIIAMIIQALTGSEDWGMATPEVPSSLGGLPDLSIVGQVDPISAFTKLGVVSTVL
ncbi:hypothetical protein OJ918_11770, partial [Streptococcus anginosus]|nr:hypothetical protein [Streptococcus anginosus]